MYIKWFNEFNEFINLMDKWIYFQRARYETPHIWSLGCTNKQKLFQEAFLIQNRKSAELEMLSYLKSKKSFCSPFPKIQGDASAFEEVKT